MDKRYDKQICLKNISLLLEKKKIKVGQLEQSIGVSPGYLSRLAKEENTTKISIELLVSLSEKLEVSMDTLACIDLSGMTPNEQYIFLFIEKLLQETFFTGRNWEKETQGALDHIQAYNSGATTHPLYHYRDGVIYYNSYFNSESPFCNIDNDVFNTEISDNTYIYLSSVSYDNVPNSVYEMYIVETNSYNNSFNVMPVCATNPKSDTAFDGKLKLLYNSVSDICKHVSVSTDVRNIIDSYMSGEDNTADDDLPF